jgi:transposase
MMGEAARKEYTPEFKREAVALVLEQGYILVEAARNLGINRDMLRRGKREVKQEGGVAFPGKGHQTLEQAELHRLQTENRRLRMERDILKKATAFFASQSR